MLLLISGWFEAVWAAPPQACRRHRRSAAAATDSAAAAAAAVLPQLPMMARRWLGVACVALASGLPLPAALRSVALLKRAHPNALPNIGYTLCLSATVFHDELVLRVVGLGASAAFMSNNLANLASATAAVNWPGAAMQALLVAGHWTRTSEVARLRLATRRRALAPRERRLYDLAFRDIGVTPQSYRALLGAGVRWGRKDAGAELAAEGKRFGRVLVLVDGSCELTKRGVVVERLQPGNIVAVGGLLGGEFLVRQTAVRAATPVEYAYWPRAALARHFDRCEPARYAMTSLLAHDDAKRLLVYQREEAARLERANKRRRRWRERGE